MPSGTRSKAVRNARSVVAASKPKPWGTVAAVLALVLFAGGVFGYLYYRYDSRVDFTPTAERQDPSLQLDGIQTVELAGGGHVRADQRVGYTTSPPLGGAHDSVWAACNGVVYETPVRSENVVHSMEHGAAWIAYNPDLVTGDALQSLRDRVQGQQYLVMSPYPGLDRPISLQSWGHQLKVDSADDERIDQFIQSLRQNQYTHPEVGATCDIPVTSFDPANPPPFDPAPPGSDAVSQDYSGSGGSQPGVVDGAAPGGAPAPAPAPVPGG